MADFLTAEWRKLIMVQYAVDPTVLTPHLPAGLELDLYRGQCFVSLVGFLFTRVRLKGIPVPLHTQFEEVNLRFYVRRVMPDGSVRRGVVFISEIVPLLGITLTARALYGEAYRTLPTRHRWEIQSNALRIGYDWKLRRRWNHLSVVADPTPLPLTGGGLEEFITEHYWGYTAFTDTDGRPKRGLLRAPDGHTGEYQVAHPSWECYPVRSVQAEADFGALYGDAFANLATRSPDNVLLAEGSAIAIRTGGSFLPQP